MPRIAENADPDIVGRVQSLRSSKPWPLPLDLPLPDSRRDPIFSDTPPLFHPRLTSLCSTIPTVGFNMKRVQKGHVTLKCWDLGGQPRFRQMWERYCRNVNAIVFIVDIADMALLPMAKEELHILMSNQTLSGIPLLVLGNKSDLPDKLTVDELIDAMDLKGISGREVSCYGISAREETNLDAVLHWLVKYANR